MMPLQGVASPVPVVHHEQDGCPLCPYAAVPSLMQAFTAAPAKALGAVTGGQSPGNPCSARAHHGFNGQGAQVVAQIAGWIRAHWRALARQSPVRSRSPLGSRVRARPHAAA
jgi:hypothetical protein